MSTAGAAKRFVRRAVPFALRVAVARWRSIGAFRRESSAFEFARADPVGFPIVVAEHRSPLRREGTTYAEKLQIGKETNVACAADFIDGIVIPAGAVFSYHHAVGNPSRRRGFVLGAELQDGSLNPGIGGGCCQVSNLLYVLALLSGAEITARHRHGLDLFPDSGRTVPFGCGATVFFPMRDLRFRNSLDQPLRIGLTIEDGYLVGRATTSEPVNAKFEIFELASEMRKEGDVWIRENQVARRTIFESGEMCVEPIAHNVARCLYDPTPDPKAAAT